MSQNKSLLATQNSETEGASPLAQRLQRRLFTSGGVINTRQLHTHYQSIQRTAGRLNQQLELPERVRSRYQISVFQPGTILQRLQRQRRESVQFPQLQMQPTLSQSLVASSQSDSGGFWGNQVEQISRVQSEVKAQKSALLTQPRRSPTPSVTESLTPLRISRQATIAATSPQFLAPSSAIPSPTLQRQVKPESNSAVAINTQSQTSNASASPISSPSSQWRVSRPETMTAVQAQFTPLAVTEAQASVPGKPQLSPEPAQELTMVQKSNLPQPEKNTVPTQAERPAELSSSVSLAQPQVQLKSRSDLPGLKATISTQAASEASLPIVKAGQVSSSLAQLQRRPVASEGLKQPLTKASMPVVKTLSSTSGDFQAQGMPATAQVKPSPSQGMPSNILQRKLRGESWASQSVSQEMGRMPLPLAINKTNNNATIARQMDTSAESMVESATQASPTISETMAEMGAAPASQINVQQLAERVSRILARQLTVERERRGINKWH